MQAVLQRPERLGRDHVDAVSGILREFQQERARFEGFTRELSHEWEQLCEDLGLFSAQLEGNEQERIARHRELAQEMQIARESQQRADDMARQLLAAQTELATCREQMDQIQQERAAVRQQIQDVNSGVLSLSELIRLVQSTYSELEHVQAALGQQANELMSSVDGPRIANLVHDERHSRPLANPGAAVEPPIEQTANTEAVDEGSADAEADVSDPIIGSVLAELARLGKQS